MAYEPCRSYRRRYREPLATNTADGTVLQGAVDRYLAENPLNEFGFSGWVGPEPHGAPLANSGFIRDPLIADRTVKWLEDRYLKRSLGDKDAQKPFLLVVSFVNPTILYCCQCLCGDLNLIPSLLLNLIHQISLLLQLVMRICRQNLLLRLHIRILTTLGTAPTGSACKL